MIHVQQECSVLVLYTCVSIHLAQSAIKVYNTLNFRRRKLPVWKVQTLSAMHYWLSCVLSTPTYFFLSSALQYEANFGLCKKWQNGQLDKASGGKMRLHLAFPFCRWFCKQVKVFILENMRKSEFQMMWNLA